MALSGAIGKPAGAPAGSASGVLQIKAPTRELCWHFSALKNVSSPTKVRIYRSLAGGPGVDQGVVLAGTYQAASCTKQPAIFLGLLAAHPQNFLLSIDSASYPRGTVRARP